MPGNNLLHNYFYNAFIPTNDASASSDLAKVWDSWYNDQMQKSGDMRQFLLRSITQGAPEIKAMRQQGLQAIDTRAADTMRSMNEQLDPVLRRSGLTANLQNNLFKQKADAVTALEANSASLDRNAKQQALSQLLGLNQSDFASTLQLMQMMNQTRQLSENIKTTNAQQSGGWLEDLLLSIAGGTAGSFTGGLGASLGLSLGNL